MVFVIPKHIVLEAGQLKGRTFCQAIAMGDLDFATVEWTLYEQRRYGRYLCRLSNADYLRKRGVKFIIDDVSTAEVWHAGKDFERWELVEGGDPGGGQGGKDDPAQRQAAGAPTKRN
jgi:hypothetical protein